MPRRVEASEIVEVVPSTRRVSAADIAEVVPQAKPSLAPPALPSPQQMAARNFQDKPADYGGLGTVEPMTDEQRKTIWNPEQGAADIAAGAKNLASYRQGPGYLDRALEGGSQVMEGVGEIGKPAAVAAMATNPVTTAAAITAGMAAQEGTRKALEAAGVSPNKTRFAANAVGALPIVGGAAKIASGLRGKPSPAFVLNTAAERAKRPVRVDTGEPVNADARLAAMVQEPLPPESLAQPVAHPIAPLVPEPLAPPAPQAAPKPKRSRRKKATQAAPLRRVMPDEIAEMAVKQEVPPTSHSEVKGEEIARTRGEAPPSFVPDEPQPSLIKGGETERIFMDELRRANAERTAQPEPKPAVESKEVIQQPVAQPPQQAGPVDRVSVGQQIREAVQAADPTKPLSMKTLRAKFPQVSRAVIDQELRGMLQEGKAQGIHDTHPADYVRQNQPDALEVPGPDGKPQQMIGVSGRQGNPVDAVESAVASLESDRGNYVSIAELRKTLSQQGADNPDAVIRAALQSDQGQRLIGGTYNGPKDGPGAAAMGLNLSDTLPMDGDARLSGVARSREGERGSFPMNAQAVRQKAQDFQERLAEIKRTFYDRLSPVQAMTEGKGLPAEKDPYVMARNFAGVMGKVENRLDELSNILPKSSFWQSLPLVRQRNSVLNEAFEIMKLERHEELAARLPNYKIEGGKTLADVQAELQARRQSLTPQQAQAIDQVSNGLRDWGNKLLLEARDAGVISDKSYQLVIQGNQKYIPFDRLEFVADQTAQFKGDSLSVAKQDILKRIQGSEKEIADPLESYVRKAVKTITLIERNKVAQSVAVLAKDPQFQGVVTPLKRRGKNAWAATKKNEEAISVLEDGKLRKYAVPAPVAEAMRGMDKEQVDLVTHWASKSAAALRAGATSLNVAFVPSNALRDFQTATAVTQGRFTPLHWARGFASSLKQDQLYKEWMESGGSFSGFFQNQQTVGKQARALTQPTSYKIAKTIVNPIELMRWASSHIEAAPRVGVYAMEKAAGKSTVEAGFASRNATVDFAKAGTVIRVINRWIPFLNARLQGNVNLFKAVGGTVRHPTARGVLTLSAIVGAPVVYTYLSNTRQYPEVWKDIADYEKQNNHILILGDAKDTKGNYTQVAKIPKGDVQFFTNPLEQFLSYMDGRDTKPLDQLAVEMLSSASPIGFEREGKVDLGQIANTLPPFAKAGLENWNNRNFYTGREIVPTKGAYLDMTKASPLQQYKADTPKAYVKASEAIHGATGIETSPLKIQNFVQTQFAGLGRQVGSATSSLMEGKFGEAAGVPGAEVARRFTGARGGAEMERNFDDLQESREKVANRDVQSTRRAMEVLDIIRPLAPADRKAKIQELVNNRELTKPQFEQLIRIIKREAKGEDAFERGLRNSKNEEKAQYVVDKLRKIPPAERTTQYQEWVNKKIITRNVHQKVLSLISGKP